MALFEVHRRAFVSKNESTVEVSLLCKEKCNYFSIFFGTILLPPHNNAGEHALCDDGTIEE